MNSRRLRGDFPMDDLWGPRAWFVFWLLWSFLISAVYWSFGPDSYLRIQDNTDFNYPYRIAAAADFLKHGITWWQPKFSGGIPAWVMPQFDSFLTAGVPFQLLPPWAAYGFVMWLQRFVAGYFTYRLCRQMGFAPIAALFAGLAFSLNRWSVADWTLYDGLGPPATPMYLYLFERFMNRRSRGFSLILVGLLGLFLGLVASSALYTVFLLAGLPVWFILVRGVSIKDGWPAFMAFISGAVLAEAPGVVAMLTYVSESSRGMWTPTAMPAAAEIWSRFWRQLLLTAGEVQPGFVLLAAVGMVMVRRFDKLTVRLLALLLLTVLGAELMQVGQIISGDILPLTTGNLRDFNQFSIIAAVLAGASGLHLMLLVVDESRRVSDLWKGRFTNFVGLSIVVLPIIFSDGITEELFFRAHTDNHNSNFNIPSLEKLANTDAEPFRVATLVANLPGINSPSGHHLYPGYAFAYGLESVDGYYRMYPKRLYEYWLALLGGLLEVYPEILDTITKRQYLFVPHERGFKRKKGAVAVVGSRPLPFADWYDLEMLSLNNTRFIISHWPLEHPRLRLVHDPAAERAEREKWLGFNRDRVRREMLRGARLPHALYIYENELVLPRAFLTGNVEEFADSDQLLAALAQRSAAKLRSSVLVRKGETPDLSGFPTVLKQAEVRLSYPRPDRVEIETAADAAAILVLTDNYDPHWRVWVDGEEADIFPVYHIYRGVRLDAGSHEIVMEYWPPYRPGGGG